MENWANINLVNGLGDKLLDLIGFYIICKYLNYKPNARFVNNGTHQWGTPIYDMLLFNFNDIIVSNDDGNSDNCSYYIHSQNPSSSLSPYKIYEFIKQFIPELTFEQISNDFVLFSKKIIQPSETILSKIPNDIENAYGIHLRKSDKVRNYDDMRHISSLNEFEIITNKLLEDAKNIILNDDEPMFLVVSEENEWKQEITNRILNIANESEKKIKIIEIDYTDENNYVNYRSILDMFCLSKCKEIFQGVKYSTFSILASLLGNNKLRNYSEYTDSRDICLIHSWSSVVEINNQKIFDEDVHRNVLKFVTNIKTNIDKIFV